MSHHLHEPSLRCILVFENIGLIHGPRFVELVQQKREELLALGPNPLAQQQTVVEGARPTWQARPSPLGWAIPWPSTMMRSG